MVRESSPEPPIILGILNRGRIFNLVHLASLFSPKFLDHAIAILNRGRRPLVGGFDWFDSSQLPLIIHLRLFLKCNVSDTARLQ